MTTPANQPVPTAGSVAADRFPPHSRYAATPVVSQTDDDGTERRYLARRFIAPTDAAPVLAQQYYGDPLLGWRIADANRALDPADLTVNPGDVLRIVSPDTSTAFGGSG